MCAEKAIRLTPQGNGRVPRDLEPFTPHALRERRDGGTEVADNQLLSGGRPFKARKSSRAFINGNEEN
jgi:hypothetical protein